VTAPPEPTFALSPIGVVRSARTELLDIKPAFAEYLPRGEVRQPAWSHEVMRDYWRSGGPRA